MFCRNIFYIWNCVWMVTGVFTGVGSLPLANIFITPRERGLLRFYGYRKASLLFAKSFLICVCGSIMIVFTYRYGTLSRPKAGFQRGPLHVRFHHVCHQKLRSRQLKMNMHLSVPECFGKWGQLSRTLAGPNIPATRWNFEVMVF